uniref:Uncharacterized protein n=1 Tax=Rhizophora mucronata TaxID=61149 RepID=A0A2P2PNP7_RHIMU
MQIHLARGLIESSSVSNHIGSVAIVKSVIF